MKGTCDEMTEKNNIKEYETIVKHRTFILAVMALAVLLMALAAILSGSSGISILDVIKTLFGAGTKQSEIIIFDMRLPRTFTAILVGSTLAMAGAVMQSVLRNPLASASTLGVSQGAAFGAALGIIVFGAGTQNSTSAASAVMINNPYIVTICAFVGGSVSTVVVLLLSRLKSMSPESLILAGVALSSLFSGGSALLQYFAADVQVAAVVFWTFGDLGRTSKTEIGIIGVCTAAAVAYFMFNRWNYNALGSGRHTAKSLGVDVNKTILISMTVCSLISAVGVAFVGIISFVGLAAPHLMRIFVGNDYRYLVPSSALCGALILLMADTFGRLIVSPVILPIGAITSFLGAPMFLYLLFKGAAKS